MHRRLFYVSLQFIETRRETSDNICIYTNFFFFKCLLFSFKNCKNCENNRCKYNTALYNKNIGLKGNFDLSKKNLANGILFALSNTWRVAIELSISWKKMGGKFCIRFQMLMANSLLHILWHDNNLCHITIGGFFLIEKLLMKIWYPISEDMITLDLLIQMCLSFPLLKHVTFGYLLFSVSVLGFQLDMGNITDKYELIHR